jgi:GMP synthase-like glutamine amidotransferase
MRNIKQLIEQSRLSYDVFDVRGKAEVPNAGEYDIYVSTGGPGSPFDGDGEMWEYRYFKFIDQVINHNLKSNRKKYLFAICHSFQLLCRKFELGNVCKRRSTSFGVLPVHKTADGMVEPYFRGLPDVFHIVDSRDYQVIHPNYANFKRLGANLLALEKERPHIQLERAMMAIRLSKEIILTQFHPEANPMGMREYFTQPDRRANVIREHGEAKYNDMLLHLHDPDKIFLTQQTILPYFFNEAINQRELQLI